MVWIRVVVLDLELHAELNDHGIVEVGTVFRDDYLGDAIPTDKVMLYEPGNHILYDLLNILVGDFRLPLRHSSLVDTYKSCGA